MNWYHSYMNWHRGWIDFWDSNPELAIVVTVFAVGLIFLLRWRRK